ncbi:MULTISPECIES: Ger(x)C family spore germination protein [unclassified Bacillus (in: firmicutes)]|uniref:Ger(x)C family spore germination protein n=1 Tax=unclassified Bacillus (in: firmicutes) TaxID=185979 RepID=UPI0008F16888|nr:MULTISPECIES: Ger(x)C family spore germination protein [unclassified Bacillus (in: firmicutes)]SFA89491.1 spore germination protein [Bacillus sp. UNCCL13]SFQ84932.1 spore germination protein [Bacillus sp. cl95]
MQKYNQTRPYHLVLIIALVIFLLTGCWSSKPIDDLNFITGSAIDKDGDGKLRSTLQYVIPKAIGNNSSAPTPQKPYINVSENGIALEPTGWETTLKREGIIFGSHQKTVIIGEALARERNLREFTDLYFRDIDIRGSTLIFISKGPADQVLETKEPGVIPALRIVEIANQELTTRILRHTSLMKIWGTMNSGTSFLLQRLDSSKGEVEFIGAAIIHGKTNKMVGSLNKKEVEGISWITGEGKGGAVKAYEKAGERATYYEIETMKSKIQPHVKGNRISFTVKIESEGRIAEYWNPYLKPAFKNKNVKHIEKAAEKEVKRLVETVTKKMQKGYKVDVAGFGNQLRIKYPKVWEDVRKDWDKEFSEIPITYDVNITIKDYGMIGSKKNE